MYRILWLSVILVLVYSAWPELVSADGSEDPMRVSVQFEGEPVAEQAFAIEVLTMVPEDSPYVGKESSQVDGRLQLFIPREAEVVHSHPSVEWVEPVGDGRDVSALRRVQWSVSLAPSVTETWRVAIKMPDVMERFAMVRAQYRDSLVDVTVGRSAFFMAGGNGLPGHVTDDPLQSMKHRDEIVGSGVPVSVESGGGMEQMRANMFATVIRDRGVSIGERRSRMVASVWCR
jgi:hypothetical protein